MALPAYADDPDDLHDGFDEADEVRLPADAHRFTVDDYLRLAETGDPTWDHTELIDGVVYDMTPQYDRHGSAVMAMARLLLPTFPDDEVRIGTSVRLSDHTVLEPDVHVFVKRTPFDDMRPIDGTDLKLAVEVSVTTLRRDRGIKARVYAAACVPVYWVVVPDPDDTYLLTHADPENGGYNRIRRIALPAGVAGLDVGDALRG